MAVAASWLIVAFLLLGIHSTEAQIGVCYGRLGDNLPCAEEVVNLYEYYNIGAMRLYEPDLPTLEALQGTNIQLMLGVRNQDISCIGSDQSNADDWVETNVLPYATTIKYIAVGNEIKPNSTEAPWVEPAMQNILCTLNANGLGTKIKAVSESGQSSGKFKKHHRFPVNFPANFPANGDGDVVTTVENAKTYYKNLIKHVKKEGTPLRPGAIETYLFAMFDEDKKPGDESERFYGLFTNDGHP
ncbi:hypothetical protein SOVF_182580, partial [Spinacia oleracea]